MPCHWSSAGSPTYIYLWNSTTSADIFRYYISKLSEKKRKTTNKVEWLILPDSTAKMHRFQVNIGTMESTMWKYNNFLQLHSFSLLSFGLAMPIPFLIKHWRIPISLTLTCKSSSWLQKRRNLWITSLNRGIYQAMPIKKPSSTTIPPNLTNSSNTKSPQICLHKKWAFMPTSP